VTLLTAPSSVSATTALRDAVAGFFAQRKIVSVQLSRPPTNHSGNSLPFDKST
jgi:hypothetical protein